MAQTPWIPLLAHADAVLPAPLIARIQHAVDGACRAALDARARRDASHLQARRGGQRLSVRAAKGRHDTTLLRDASGRLFGSGRQGDEGTRGRVRVADMLPVGNQGSHGLGGRDLLEHGWVGHFSSGPVGVDRAGGGHFGSDPVGIDTCGGCGRPPDIRCLRIMERRRENAVEDDAPGVSV